MFSEIHKRLDKLESYICALPEVPKTITPENFPNLIPCAAAVRNNVTRKVKIGMSKRESYPPVHDGDQAMRDAIERACREVGCDPDQTKTYEVLDKAFW